MKKKEVDVIQLTGENFKKQTFYFTFVFLFADAFFFKLLHFFVFEIYF